MAIFDEESILAISSLHVEGLNTVIYQIILTFILIILHVIVSFLQTIG